jgi:hypothetical protein
VASFRVADGAIPQCQRALLLTNRLQMAKLRRQTFQALADEFRESDAPVTRSMEKLKELRDKLGGGRISEQIDIVLNDYRFGKNIVRDKISYIIFHRKKDTDITETARSICADIATLNAEIARLERMVSLR